MSGPEAVKALRRAGFVVRRQSSSHVVLTHPERDRPVSVPVHAARDVKPGTLRGIIRDAGLSVEAFRRLLRYHSRRRPPGMWSRASAGGRVQQLGLYSGPGVST
ncbi:MAG: type II toxin-antitoxin system HicA family toxin [Armatimonadota bacterium]